VQLVQFLPPETLRQQRFRMSRRLPESALAIVTRGLAQHVAETRWKMFRTVVAQLPPGELPKVRQDRRQGRRIEIPMKDDGVQCVGMITKALVRRPFCWWQNLRLSVTIRNAASETNTGSH